MELNLESTSAKMDCPTQKNLGIPLGMFLAPSLRIPKLVRVGGNLG